MTWRTPSSLKWLIDKRSRLAGLLPQLTQEQMDLGERLEVVTKRIATVQRQLQALDCTFELHEVQIEPQEIAGISPHKKSRLMPHGRMGRLILNALRHHGGWMPTGARASAHREGFLQTVTEPTDRWLGKDWSKSVP